MNEFPGLYNKFERLDFNGDSGQYPYQTGNHVHRKADTLSNNGFHLLPKGERSNVEYRPCKKYTGKAAERRMKK